MRGRGVVEDFLWAVDYMLVTFSLLSSSVVVCCDSVGDPDAGGDAIL